ncbi:hypothetical protein DFP72DRAFT_1174030 [Ephemerocybe angulata]|uniref:Uncharacterized protein n=1 Tax=Ephemerocybe angulata TaxID=980116 RepID=A0A8H6HLW6_9AGAR|nr:hypothetical protein DFP72DRAFT_1174030 [Tulosesus angulatus]
MPPNFSTWLNLWSNWGQRIQLLSFLVMGTLFAIGHHLMCKSLDGRLVRGDGIRMHGKVVVSDQALLSAGSNALSQLVKYCYSATVGVAFAQYFWTVVAPFSSRKGESPGRDTPTYRALPSKSTTEQLSRTDAPVAAAEGNPFLPSAICAWAIAPGLAFVSLLMMVMIPIQIVAPGSIHVVSSEYGVPLPCSIPSDVSMVHISGIYETPKLVATAVRVRQVEPTPTEIHGTGDSQHDINDGTTVHIHTPSIRTKAIVNNVLISGAYLQVPASPCARCSYKVSFTGPSLQCSSAEANRTYDFWDIYFGGYGGLSGSQMLLLRGLFDHTTDNILSVATQDGSFISPNPPFAVACQAFSSTYFVRVRYNVSSAIEVLKVVMGERINFDSDEPHSIQLAGMVEAVGLALQGRIGFRSGTEELNPVHNTAYSPLLRWTRGERNQSTFEWSNMERRCPRSCKTSA